MTEANPYETPQELTAPQMALRRKPAWLRNLPAFVAFPFALMGVFCGLYANEMAAKGFRFHMHTNLMGAEGFLFVALIVFAVLKLAVWLIPIR